MKPMEARRHHLLAGVADAAARVLRAHGIDPAIAEQAAAAVADCVAEEHSGQVVYFPHDMGYKLAPRDRAILEAHRAGTTLYELRRTYGLTEEGIKKLLRRAASREPDLDQGKLFNN